MFSVYHSFVLEEKKMQSKNMLRAVDDDIDSSYKIIPDIFDFLLERCECFCVTLLVSLHHMEAAMMCLCDVI